MDVDSAKNKLEMEQFSVDLKNSLETSQHLIQKLAGVLRRFQAVNTLLLLRRNTALHELDRYIHTLKVWVDNFDDKTKSDIIEAFAEKAGIITEVMEEVQREIDTLKMLSNESTPFLTHSSNYTDEQVERCKTLVEGFSVMFQSSCVDLEVDKSLPCLKLLKHKLEDLPSLGKIQTSFEDVDTAESITTSKPKFEGLLDNDITDRRIVESSKTSTVINVRSSPRKNSLAIRKYASPSRYLQQQLGKAGLLGVEFSEKIASRNPRDKLRYSSTDSLKSCGSGRDTPNRRVSPHKECRTTSPVIDRSTQNKKESSSRTREPSRDSRLIQFSDKNPSGYEDSKSQFNASENSVSSNPKLASKSVVSSKARKMDRPLDEIWDSSDEKTDDDLPTKKDEIGRKVKKINEKITVTFTNQFDGENFDLPSSSQEDNVLDINPANVYLPLSSDPPEDIDIADCDAKSTVCQNDLHTDINPANVYLPLSSDPPEDIDIADCDAKSTVCQNDLHTDINPANVYLPLSSDPPEDIDIADCDAKSTVCQNDLHTDINPANVYLPLSSDPPEDIDIADCDAKSTVCQNDLHTDINPANVYLPLSSDPPEDIDIADCDAKSTVCQNDLHTDINPANVYLPLSSDPPEDIDIADCDAKSTVCQNDLHTDNLNACGNATNNHDENFNTQACDTSTNVIFSEKNPSPHPPKILSLLTAINRSRSSSIGSKSSLDLDSSVENSNGQKSMSSCLPPLRRPRMAITTSPKTPPQRKTDSEKCRTDGQVCGSAILDPVSHVVTCLKAELEQLVDKSLGTKSLMKPDILPAEEGDLNNNTDISLNNSNVTLEKLSLTNDRTLDSNNNQGFNNRLLNSVGYTLKTISPNVDSLESKILPRKEIVKPLSKEKPISLEKTFETKEQIPVKEEPISPEKTFETKEQIPVKEEPISPEKTFETKEQTPVKEEDRSTADSSPVCHYNDFDKMCGEKSPTCQSNNTDNTSEEKSLMCQSNSIDKMSAEKSPIFQSDDMEKLSEEKSPVHQFNSVNKMSEEKSPISQSNNTDKLSQEKSPISQSNDIDKMSERKRPTCQSNSRVKMSERKSPTCQSNSRVKMSEEKVHKEETEEVHKNNDTTGDTGASKIFQQALKSSCSTGFLKGSYVEPPISKHIRSHTKGRFSHDTHIPPIPCKLKLKFGYFGTEKSGLKFPIGVCTNSKGEVIVADTGNHSVKMFDPDGNYLREVDCELVRPSAVLVNRRDEIFVKDDLAVHIFKEDCRYLRSIGKGILTKPFGLALTPNELIITLDANWKNPQVFILSQDGRDIRSFPFTALLDYLPQSKCRFLAVHKDILVISDLGASCVYITDSMGQTINTFGSYGSGQGQFREPSGVAIDGHGHIIIGDSKNDRLQIFSSMGQYICGVKFNDPITRPSDIHLTGDGHLLVTNFLQHQIKVYKLGEE